MSDHYFSAQPSGPFDRKRIRAAIWGRDLQLDSGSGVFSHGHLDLGTSTLFRSAQPPDGPGSYLDLGCGYGAIAIALAAAAPASSVWAVDVNARALALTRDNAVLNGVDDRVRAVLPDELPGEVRFDEIWSNPPIRVGKQALHELLLTWLPRLADGGRAVLVVGKNLGADSLQRWISEQGFRCDRIASAKGFRVLEVRRTKKLGAATQPKS